MKLILLDFYRDYQTLIQDFLSEWGQELLRLSPDRESWPVARQRMLARIRALLGDNGPT